ncbi:MAG: hypothetical protein HYU53_15665 [Acidobacteria bacterium]|nr:hypothetical protein [Acidobacteriota bacterium]
MDRNGNGEIDDGTELFGSAVPLNGGGVAAHGFQALAELDANGDRLLDAGDPGFAPLRLWFDRNRNGFSESGELELQSSSGVVAVSTAHFTSGHRDRWGNLFFKYRGQLTATSEPRVRSAHNVLLT